MQIVKHIPCATPGVILLAILPQLLSGNAYSFKLSCANSWSHITLLTSPVANSSLEIHSRTPSLLQPELEFRHAILKLSSYSTKDLQTVELWINIRFGPAGGQWGFKLPRTFSWKFYIVHQQSTLSDYIHAYLTM